MMGALVNIGCQIGSGTMIDMGAVLGGRVIVGNNSHVGAGSVLAGVIEPPSATPVTIGDNVLIGANVVVLEGVKIGDGAVVGAGSIVTSDVEANTVVVGNPARVVKFVDQAILDKTQILDELRKL
jgi:2,3,4,5-tetrahydropyridine-2,6-dicarboxylate N-acetyltransferase